MRRSGARPTGLLAALAVTVAAVGACSRPAEGSRSGGDAYFEHAGNGGYDARHYELTLTYDPADGKLIGTAIVTLTAETDLRSFSLDLRGPTATSVQVDGEAATFEQVAPDRRGRGGELVIRPEEALQGGAVHEVTVEYEAVAGQPEDIEGGTYGFVRFPDGAFVANEPEGASTWYPVNDVPSDKATYDFSITVPEGTTAVANGDLVSSASEADGRVTFRWRAEEPMASYLSTASIGDYDETRQAGPGGLPIVNYVERDLAPGDRATTEASLARQPEMIDFFDDIYGPYPFTSFGAIVDDDRVGYALETQTRPVYSGSAEESTVAHELAHQWVGNSVTPEQWKDIWLNEGARRTRSGCGPRPRGRPPPRSVSRGSTAPRPRTTSGPFRPVIPARSGSSRRRRTNGEPRPCTRCARRSATTTSSRSSAGGPRTTRAATSPRRTSSRSTGRSANGRWRTSSPPGSTRPRGPRVTSRRVDGQPAGTRTSSVCRPSRYSTPSPVSAMPCSSAIRTR